MARKLSPGTLNRLRQKLEEERESLARLLDEHEQEREEARLAETASERSPDPMTAEGGSMAFEYEKELSIDQNAADLLIKVEHALGRLERGEYGICESCGASVPVARLEALPYVTLCVDCARDRR
jgi:RNA polymerase-binding protein DksA